MQVCCELCGRKEEYVIARWCCDCGGAWTLIPSRSFQSDLIEKDVYSIWRYRSFFPAEIAALRESLGAGLTPLLPCTIDDRVVCLKLDFLNPTGSFKDRGIELMMNALAAARVEQVVEDSSGNAGASVAAYAARLGMRASIFAPQHASPAKLAQIAMYGAAIHTIPGSRLNASQAAFEAVGRGVVFASHAWNPLYLLGQQTAAWELWEQNDHRAPDWVVVPVGQGGNLLGYFEGFRLLLAAGLIQKLPGLIAVQPQRLAPICDAFEQGWKEWVEVCSPSVPSVAEGLAISWPVRWRHIVRAIKESGGFCVKVPEEDIIPAQRWLAERGFYVEPTSAVVMAAYQRITKIVERNQSVVFSLTGNGLKANPASMR
jgi:threonine synthase